jgi:hypothetical protein
MALSNWDTAAWDKDGNPMAGTLTCGKVSVEIYKNWIYVRDSECWIEEHKGFGNQCVMEIQFGDVQYRGFSIKAIRGPQNSIMTVVQYGYQEDKDYVVMYAIGGYAYQKGECVGILPKTVEKFRNAKFFKDELISFPEFKSLRRYNQGDAFIAKELFGCTPKDVCTEVGHAKPTLVSNIL